MVCSSFNSSTSFRSSLDSDLGMRTRMCTYGVPQVGMGGEGAERVEVKGREGSSPQPSTLPSPARP